MPIGSSGKPVGSQNQPIQQGPLADGYPLLVNIAPGLALLVDVTDRAGRLLGIVYGENAQLQQSAPGDALPNPANPLEVVTFGQIYDQIAGDWNVIRQGATEGSVMVEDTGLNTNPRRYEKDNGFYSAVVARAAGATALWTIATVPARTAGQDTTIYTLEIENSTGAAITAWLEIGGVAITAPVHVTDDNSVVITYAGGFNTGDADINCNASVNAVVFSIKGTEA